MNGFWIEPELARSLHHVAHERYVASSGDRILHKEQTRGDVGACIERMVLNKRQDLEEVRIVVHDFEAGCVSCRRGFDRIGDSTLNFLPQVGFIGANRHRISLVRAIKIGNDRYPVATNFAEEHGTVAPALLGLDHEWDLLSRDFKIDHS